MAKYYYQEIDSSQTYNCFGCIQMYDGFVFLSWVVLCLSPLDILKHILYGLEPERTSMLYDNEFYPDIFKSAHENIIFLLACQFFEESEKHENEDHDHITGKLVLWYYIILFFYILYDSFWVYTVSSFLKNDNARSRGRICYLFVLDLA